MPFPKSRPVTAFIFFLFFCCLASCHFTTTIEKPPLFSIPEDSVANRILNKIACQNIRVSGSASNTDGHISTLLTVSIYNGQAVPKNNDGMLKLAKAIAGEMKKSLKNDTAFQILQVKFVTEEKKGITTNSSYQTFDFDMPGL